MQRAIDGPAGSNPAVLEYRGNIKFLKLRYYQKVGQPGSLKVQPKEPVEELEELQIKPRLHEEPEP